MMHKGATNSGPTVAVPYTLKIRSGCEGGGKGALVQTDMSATLATNNDQYLFQPMSIRDENWASSDVKNAIRAGESKSSHCVIEQHLFENHSQDSRYRGPLDACPVLPAQLGTGGNNTPFVVESERAYCLQGNGIDRADTAGCNGKGWTEDVCYTLNTIDRPAVAHLASGKPTVGTLMANAGTKLWLGNQEALSGDYHIIEGTPVRYIVRRLTPTECARLQGFPDAWGHPDSKDDFTEEEYRFWLEVRNTHATINGKAVKDYTKEQMVKWYNGLHTDSAEYKLWGNGIALPPALYCMQGIRDALDREMEPIVEPEDELPEEVRKAFGSVLDQILQRIESIEKRLKEVAM